MLRSLYSGISGMRLHQTLMDVVANDIANVNTTGFKASGVTFEDTMSQLVKSAAAPTGASGGTNPAQVGLGAQLAAITTDFGQGSAQNTGRSTDLMLDGDGLFVLRKGAATTYTRAGAFSFDAEGRLTTPDGSLVQGWSATAGVVDTNAPLSTVTLPVGTMLPPEPTSAVTGAGNIPAGTTTPVTLGATAYDAAGRTHALSIVLTPNATGFDVTVTDTSDPASAATAGTLVLDAAGRYDPSSTAASVQLADGAGGALGTTVTLDLSGVTGFGGPPTLAVTKVDGNSAGSLQQFQVTSDGTVVGFFSNGVKQAVAQIAVSTFNNPSGLERVSGTAFRVSADSGLPQVGTAASGGRGTIVGGSVEMSNVDLAGEFTRLIVAQRGFQANSRVITTSDQLLEELTNLKR